MSQRPAKQNSLHQMGQVLDASMRSRRDLNYGSSCLDGGLVRALGPVIEGSSETDTLSVNGRE